MASSRIVGYTEAQPTFYKPGPLKRLQYALKKKGQGFVGKNKKKLKEQGERALDNVNFALTNQMIYAIWGTVAGTLALASSGTVRAAIASFMRGAGGDVMEMASKAASRVGRG